MQFSTILFIVVAGCINSMYGNQNISFSNLSNSVSRLYLISVRNLNTDLILVALTFNFQVNYIIGNIFLGLERKPRNQSTECSG